MKLIKIAVVLLPMLMGVSARAGLLLEPYLSYESSNQDAKFLGADASGKSTGVQLGARVGYTLPVLFWLALDYSLINDGTFKPDSGSSEKVSRSDLYLDAGFDFPILVRAWFGYGIGNKATLKSSLGDSDLEGGSSYKLGVGFTALPIVSINLEYFSNDFEKVDGTKLSDIASSFKDTGFRLGVSAPFDL